MQTVKEVIEKIQEQANQNQANPVLRVVQIPKLKTGECYRQGDLYIFKVADNHPVGKELDRRQLADGHSIGQRHVITGGDFKIYESVKPPVLPKGYGQIKDLNVRAGKGYAFDILELNDTRNAHPEHSHFVFQQCGRYQVHHQTDFYTLERVAD